MKSDRFGLAPVVGLTRYFIGVYVMKKERNGRATEMQAELDSLIDELKRLQRRAEALGCAPTVDVSAAIGHARHVRDLIEIESQNRWKCVQECINFLTRLAKDLHSLLNCYLSQRKYESWVCNKAA